jgi:hypothetical protein
MFVTLLCWMILKLKRIEVSLGESIALVFSGLCETILYMILIGVLTVWAK